MEDLPQKARRPTALLNVQVTSWKSVYLFALNSDKSMLLVYLLVLEDAGLKVLPLRKIALVVSPKQVWLDRFGHFYYHTPFDLERSFQFGHCEILNKFYNCYSQVQAMCLARNHCFMVGKRRLSKEDSCLIVINTSNLKVLSELSFHLKAGDTCNLINQEESVFCICPSNVVVFQVKKRKVEQIHVIDITLMPHARLFDFDSRKAVCTKEDKSVLVASLADKAISEIDFERCLKAKLKGDVVLLFDGQKVTQFLNKYSGNSQVGSIEVAKYPEKSLNQSKDERPSSRKSSFRPGSGSSARSGKTSVKITHDLQLLSREAEKEQNLVSFILQIGRELVIVYEASTKKCHKIVV